MLPYMTTHFGNPSSISYGRETRLAIESARKTVARLLNTSRRDLFYLRRHGKATTPRSCLDPRPGLPAYHHVAHRTPCGPAYGGTLRPFGGGGSSFVRLKPDGHVDLEDLEAQLASREERCLVSLMHANNEIGNLLPIKAVGGLCNKHNAIFHSDCVQTVGHYPIDLRKIPVHFYFGGRP